MPGGPRDSPLPASSRANLLSLPIAPSGVCEEGSIGFGTRDWPAASQTPTLVTVSPLRALGSRLSWGGRVSRLTVSAEGPARGVGAAHPPGTSVLLAGRLPRSETGGHSQTVSQPWRTWLCLRPPPPQASAGIFCPAPAHLLAAMRRAWRCPGTCSGEMLLGGAPGRHGWPGASRRLTPQSWRPEVKIRPSPPPLQALVLPWLHAPAGRGPFPGVFPRLSSSPSPLSLQGTCRP